MCGLPEPRKDHALVMAKFAADIRNKTNKLVHELRETLGLTVFLITHDLGIVAQTAQHVIVMYAGKVVESSNVSNIFENPLHPYTRGLLRSIPSEETIINKTKLTEIPGIVPNLSDLPAGCPFHPRSDKIDRCMLDQPQLSKYDETHAVSCWLYPTATA